jgi:hypothetical protein
MEEIIAKSKMYKALKARQREDDEAEMNKVCRRGGMWGGYSGGVLFWSPRPDCMGEGCRYGSTGT